MIEMNPPLELNWTKRASVAMTLLLITMLSGCGPGPTAKVSSPDQVADFKGDPSKMPADAKARMQGGLGNAASTPR